MTAAADIDQTRLWVIIIAVALGTFLLRYSFLGMIGNRNLPPPVLRLLRYTAVGVLPGLIAPLVVWPQATGGQPDPARLLATAATIAVAMYTRSVIWSIVAGAAMLYSVLYITG